MMMKAKAKGTPEKLLVILVKLTIQSRTRLETLLRLAAAKEAMESPTKELQNESHREFVKLCRKNGSERIST